MAAMKRYTISTLVALCTLAISCFAQQDDGTVITLPGGITVSTQSLMIGILAVVAVIIIGVVMAARRSNAGTTNTTVIRDSRGVHVEQEGARNASAGKASSKEESEEKPRYLSRGL